MNTGTATARYDSLSILLHWATAALVLLLFALAEFWDFFPRPPASPDGCVAYVIRADPHRHFRSAHLLARQARPCPLSRRTGPRWARGPGALSLYTLLAAEIPLGFLTRWMDNHPLSFFGLLIPSPLGTVPKPLGKLVDQIHDITAWTIIVLAGVHALAALCHHYLLKDGVLRRMLPRHAG